MKTILVEGIPGTGKTTLSEAVCSWLQDRGSDVKLLSERVQDEEIFSDYWERFDGRPERMAKQFVRRWRQLLRARQRVVAAYVLDNALFNQVQYLLALDADEDAIVTFYRQVSAELLPYGPLLIFLEGDAEIITRRIMAERMGRWTERVIELISQTPYQQARRRSGPDGLVAFMCDSMALRERLIEEALLPVVRCDVTPAAWEDQTRVVLRGLGERYPGV